MKNNRFARFAAAALSLAMLAGCGGSHGAGDAHFALAAAVRRTRTAARRARALQIR